MHKKYLFFLAFGSIVVFLIGWNNYETSQIGMVVPVLQSDGTIGAARGQRSGIFASIVRQVVNMPGVLIRIFDPGESVQIENVSGKDFIAFDCPVGTNTPSYAVLGSVHRFYTSERYWAWGEYLGNEGQRIANGDSPSAVFPQAKFLGNSAAQQGGMFPFVGSKTHFGPGRFVTSGGPSGVAFVDCLDRDSDGLNDNFEQNGMVGTSVSDADSDDDGIIDGKELTPSPDFYGFALTASTVTNPVVPDTDGDGLTDGVEQGLSFIEICLHDGISLPASCADSDGDLLPNAYDTGNAAYVDADNDKSPRGMDPDDSTASLKSTDMTVAAARPDTNRTTTTNPTVVDTDGGGVSDGIEDASKNGDRELPCETDPLNPSDDTISCGDTILQSCGANRATGGGDDEVCDDGPLNGTPGHCNTTCSGPVAPACGDGLIDAGEGCDDGNTVSGDGCTNLCQDEFCGDGVVNDSGETCDEAGLNGTPNHCDATCSGTTPSVCGNSVTEAGEDCDDGSITATCDADCTVVTCGDSTTNAIAGEECDDGNIAGGDGCDALCMLEVCGDGVVQMGEECDDGETCTGDGQWCNPPEAGGVECSDPTRNAGTCQRNDNDGCSNNCEIDAAFYACTGTALSERTSCEVAAPGL